MGRLKFPKWSSQFILIGLGIALAVSLSAWPVGSQSAGKIRVATEPAFPPFEMKDEQSGGLQGFDIDVMTAIGNASGRTVEFVSLPFDGIIPALQAKTIDAAISGMTITSERAQAVDFSRPYFKAGLAIAVKETETKINDLADLKGKRIAVQIGTTGAQKAATVEQANVSTFDSAVLALQELLNGKVDAVVNDLPATLYAINEANLPGIKIVGQLLTEEYYGIALPKGSANLAAVNSGLETILQNGVYQSIYEKWFNERPPNLPLIAPALKQQQQSSFNWGTLLRNLLIGAGVTLTLTGASFFFGLIGGTLVALALISPYKLLRWGCRIYVDFFRGTPMLVQLFMIYFGLPALFQELGLALSFDRFPAAIMALSLNVAAYLAEIMRGGIASIDRGQWEAGESLAMTPLQTMRYIILPQAFRRMLPPLGNEFITLIKDTSLAAVIGFEELFRQGQLVVATTYKAFEIYLAVALVYLVLTTTASLIFKQLEHQMDPIARTTRKAARAHKASV